MEPIFGLCFSQLTTVDRPSGRGTVTDLNGPPCHNAVVAYSSIGLWCWAARRLGRPVKLVVSGEDMYTAGSFRPATTQHVALAAVRDGNIQALIHEQNGQTSRMTRPASPAPR
jgi:CO/xanthine dehydrogenase Mo-binding subunit